MALRYLVRSLFVLVFLGSLIAACCATSQWRSSAGSSLFSGIQTSQMGISYLAHAQAAVLDEEATKVSIQNQPVLVEMFLSQSCSSCVPAAAYVRTLAARDDVVVIAWHVDYWDTLNVARHGRWKDPYSSPDYTERQRDYARTVFRTARVYTPQAIIHGDVDIVGADQPKIDRAITLKKSERSSTGPSLQVERNNSGLIVKVDQIDTLHTLLMVDFHKSTQTSILGGENAGVNWNEANVVTEVHRIGAVTAEDNQVTISKTDLEDDPSKGCALILQSATGQAVAALYCPT